MVRSLFLCLSLLYGCNSVAIAASNTNTETEQQNSNNDEFGWQVAVDFSLIQNGSNIIGSKEENFGDWLGMNLLVDLYYKRFFIQSDAHRFANSGRDTRIGFHLYQKKDWQLDIVHSNYMSGFSEESAGLVHEEIIEELRGIDERNYDGSTGFRFTRTRENSQLGIDIVADVIDNTHGGWIIEAYYSKVFPVKNWDVYLGGGFSFYSSEATDYYYTVRPHEVTEARPEYKASSGYKVMTEAVAQYPISESWLFFAGLALTSYSRSIADSPLTRSQHLLQGTVNFRYAF